MINLNDKIPGAPNFLWKEMFASSTAARHGWSNYPDSEGEEKYVLNNLRYVAAEVQKARDYFGVPIRINSGYRSDMLNKIIGGSSTSFHSHGQAVDLSFPSGSPRVIWELFSYFHAQGVYTELIAEEISKYGGWVHFALAEGRQLENQLKYKLAGGMVRRAKFEEIKQIMFTL